MWAYCCEAVWLSTLTFCFNVAYAHMQRASMLAAMLNTFVTVTCLCFIATFFKQRRPPSRALYH